MTEDEYTDRDRLAMAFDDLRDRGYIADVSLGYRTCCRDCALAIVAETADIRDEDDDLMLPSKFVFWHMAKDDYSFVGEAEGFPLPKEFEGKNEEWLNKPENLSLVEAVMMNLRISNYVWLINPLNLHWMGNADEIVGALRRQGLQAAVPNSDHWCIEVSPTHSREWVEERVREEQKA